MTPENPLNNQYPVHEDLDVIDGQTIYKSDDWWKAVVLYDGYRGSQIGVYVWKQMDGSWKRKQKYKIDGKDDWEQDREAIEALLKKMETE